MDVAHRAVLEQRRGDEQAVVLGLLHERDDRGDAARRVREPSQARIGGRIETSALRSWRTYPVRPSSGNTMRSNRGRAPPR